MRSGRQNKARIAVFITLLLCVALFGVFSWRLSIVERHIASTEHTAETAAVIRSPISRNVIPMDAEASNYRPAGKSVTVAFSHVEQNLATRKSLSGNELQSVQLVLNDQDPDNRIHTLQNFGDSKDGVLMRLLVATLQSDPNERVREEVVLISGALDVSQSLLILSHALSDPSDNVRLAAVEVLAELGESASQLLAQLLFSEPEPLIRLHAVDAIAWLDSTISASLLNIAVKDEAEIVRDQASFWLQQLNFDEPPTQQNIVLESELLSMSVGNLSGSLELDQAEQLALIEHIGSVEPDDGIDILAGLLSLAPSADVRGAALQMLAGINSVAATNKISVALHDPSVLVRRSAINALGISGETNLSELGQAIYTEQEPELIRLIADYISRWHSPAADAFLDLAAKRLEAVTLDRKSNGL